jgi:parallel beta-helix repeat protein
MGVKSADVSRADNMKKAVVLALILISLMALGMVCVRPVKAQTQNDITINSDGTVSPSTAPIQQTGNVYTLTSNMDGSIAVGRNNTVFDGNGHTLRGEFSMNDVSNVTLKKLTVTELNINNPEDGIVLANASNVLVTNNTVTDIFVTDYFFLNGVDFYGIEVSGGSSNVITENNVINNFIGMIFFGTSDNLIVENNFTNNGFGLNFWDASNNTIYHNNFVNNGAGDGNTVGNPNSINNWDDGYPGGGNYWSNYDGIYQNINHHKVTEIDNSGIGDMPFVIDAKNKDRYPLVEPFNASYLVKYEQEITPPKISVLLPLNQTYSNSTVHLVFTVDKAINWTGYSLDGQQNVTITGNTTIANITSGLHNIIVYANDTYGNIGASQIISFTIAKPEPFPTATVAAVSGIVAVVVGLLVYFKKHKPKTHRVIEGKPA